MQPQLLSLHSSLFRDCVAALLAATACLCVRMCVLPLAVSDVCVCVHVYVPKWQVLKELPDGCVLRGRLPRLMMMKN